MTGPCMSDIERNLRDVEARVQAALARAGRPADSCRLVAVTKVRSAADVMRLAAAGQREFGENRIQEAAKKISEVGAPGRWHLIGHLQRNKVKKALSLFDVIHSVDSVRLLEEIGRSAEALSKPMEILLEVNSGEEQKQGLDPADVPSVCRAAREFTSLRLTGLMTMAPIARDPEEVRPVFRRLRELRDGLNEAGVYAAPLTELSMGMTQDYEIAAEEGATWVRVGSALFA